MRINVNVLRVYWLMALLCLPFTVTYAATDMAALVNTAGMQRMLSQRITKDYLFLGNQVRVGKAKRQMQGSVSLILNNHAELGKSVTDAKVQELLSEIDPLLEKVVNITEAPYTKVNGATMLELSETLLGLNQAVVMELESRQAEKIVSVVNTAGRQRMLSQRVAMFYAAHQAGLQSDTTRREMAKAIEEFEAAHVSLENDEHTSEQISAELRGVENLWKTVRGYFSVDVEKSYPVTAFVTTDDIMKRMNKITLLYVKAHWAMMKK